MASVIHLANKLLNPIWINFQLNINFYECEQAMHESKYASSTSHSGEVLLVICIISLQIWKEIYLVKPLESSLFISRDAQAFFSCFTCTHKTNNGILIFCCLLCNKLPLVKLERPEFYCVWKILTMHIDWFKRI